MSAHLFVVRLSGCDDETEFEMVLTQEQADGVRRTAEASEKESSASCQPVMSISLPCVECGHPEWNHFAIVRPGRTMVGCNGVIDAEDSSEDCSCIKFKVAFS